MTLPSWVTSAPTWEHHRHYARIWVRYVCTNVISRLLSSVSPPREKEDCANLTLFLRRYISRLDTSVPMCSSSLTFECEGWYVLLAAGIKEGISTKEWLSITATEDDEKRGRKWSKTPWHGCQPEVQSVPEADYQTSITHVTVSSWQKISGAVEGAKMKVC